MFAAALILSLTTTESTTFLGKLFSCGGKQLPKDADETRRPHRAGPASTDLHTPHAHVLYDYDDRQSGARRSAKQPLIQAAAVENFVQAQQVAAEKVGGNKGARVVEKVEKVHAAQTASSSVEKVHAAQAASSSVEKVRAAQAAACGSEQTPTTAERPYVSLERRRRGHILKPANGRGCEPEPLSYWGSAAAEAVETNDS